MSPRILVIDDHKEWRESYLSTPLDELGFDIHKSTGRDAEKILRSPQYDLVVLNIRLDEYSVDETQVVARCTTIMDTVYKQSIHLLVVTAPQLWDSTTIAKLVKIAFQDYGAKDFFFKNDFNAIQYRNRVMELLRTVDNDGTTQLHESTPRKRFELAFDEKEKLIELICTVDLWRNGQHIERRTILVATSLPEPYINHLGNLDGSPDDIASRVIDSMERRGFLPERVKHTYLSTLLLYLHKTCDLDGQKLCAELIIKYKLTNDDACITKMQTFLQT